MVESLRMDDGMRGDATHQPAKIGRFGHALRVFPMKFS